MAVSKVRKLELMAHAQCREEILATLRSLGAVHISDIKELSPESQNEFPPFLQSSLSQVEEKLARISYCLLFVEKFAPKSSFTQTLFKSRPVFTQQELEDCIANFEPEKFHEECTSIETELEKNENQIEKKATLIQDVTHWHRLDCPLEHIRDTRSAHVSLGTCDARALKPMADEMAEVSSVHHIEIVERSRTSVSMVLIYSRAIEESIAPILRKCGWRAVKFIGLTGTPAEALEQLREQIRELQERNRQLREHVRNEFVPSLNKLMLLHDHYSQELQTLKMQHNFLFTSRTFLINGWIVASQEKMLKRRLREVTPVAEVRCSEPTPDDRVPILLENRPMIKPFALITELYGRPQYTEFDPTPLLAPFFALFFGICLGDAGYGLVLAIGSYIALKKFEIRGGARNLLQILIGGGIASTLVGLLTGGIFGIKTAKLPAVLKGFMMFNPTEQVLLFLYITFGLGVIQILFGLCVKLAHNIRERNISGAIMDQGLWLLFLVSLVPLVYKILFGGDVPENIISFAATSAKLFAVGLVLTQGRQVKIILLRPVMGLFKLYDTMGYFSDVLSYARLMALGLATAYLAMTINDIAELLLGIPFGIGYVAAALVLVFGHTFNLLINCLSAFVHTLRLQYLEFFSKFFIGGGEPFRPFAEERQYTIVQSDVR